MNKSQFKITSLTCTACSKLTTKRLKTITGVDDATVELASGKADIIASRVITLDDVRTVLIGSQYGAEAYDE